MSNIEKAKEVIKEYYRSGDLGIFNSHNSNGDMLDIVYEGNGLTIAICYYYSYFEVFGLSYAEFKELENYYNSLEATKHSL